MITILGPTATGKTHLAVHIANHINGEIISADSRQVYKGMDIGTGKDLDEYKVNGENIPYHLIDIIEAGAEYNLYNYQQDFLKAYQTIKNNGRKVIFCGGSGMYLESVILGYDLTPVPIDENFHKHCEGKSINELQIELMQYNPNVHNTTDLCDRKRLIRAIEIQKHKKKHPEEHNNFPMIDNLVFGIQFERNVIRNRITERLKKRLENNDLIKEVEKLIQQGVSKEMLKFYGLEYRYITSYLSNEISYQEMFNQLNTAIHQFAKRQMTWFRRMEKKGIVINWIDGNLDLDEKVDIILQKLDDDKIK